jgi:hypothetical protein
MTNNRFEPLETGRYFVKRVDGALQVIVPAQLNWFIMAFMSFWLACWTMGGVAAARTVLGLQGGLTMKTVPGQGSGFLVIWLCMWCLGEVTVLYQLLWMMLGRETLSLSHSALKYSKGILGLGFTKNYDLAHVSRLRVADTPIRSGRNQMTFGGASAVAFDYGNGTVFMAKGLDEGEARSIVNHLIASNITLKQRTTYDP